MFYFYWFGKVTVVFLSSKQVKEWSIDVRAQDYKSIPPHLMFTYVCTYVCARYGPPQAYCSIAIYQKSFYGTDFKQCGNALT